VDYRVPLISTRAVLIWVLTFSAPGGGRIVARVPQKCRQPVVAKYGNAASPSSFLPCLPYLTLGILAKS
jgi:hypothetical protein